MSDQGERKVSRLAQRFQAAIDQDAATKRIAEEQERLEKAQLEQSRVELFDALAAFGEAVSWFEVERSEGKLVLRFQERSLRFESVGERGKIKVEGDGLDGDNKLFLQQPLNRWVWSREDRYGREHRELLLDAGLENLITVVFEVAPLEEGDMPAGRPAPRASEPADPAEPADTVTPEQAVPFPSKTL